MLSAVLGRAHEASFRVVLLEVRRDNAPAQNLYAGLGFEVVGTVPRAFDSAAHGRVGLHVMHLDLS